MKQLLNRRKDNRRLLIINMLVMTLLLGVVIPYGPVPIRINVDQGVFISFRPCIALGDLPSLDLHNGTILVDELFVNNKLGVKSTVSYTSYGR